MFLNFSSFVSPKEYAISTIFESNQNILNLKKKEELYHKINIINTTLFLISCFLNKYYYNYSFKYLSILKNRYLIDDSNITISKYFFLSCLDSFLFFVFPSFINIKIINYIHNNNQTKNKIYENLLIINQILFVSIIINNIFIKIINDRPNYLLNLFVNILEHYNLYSVSIIDKFLIFYS